MEVGGKFPPLESFQVGEMYIYAERFHGIKYSLFQNRFPTTNFFNEVNYRIGMCLVLTIINYHKNICL